MNYGCVERSVSLWVGLSRFSLVLRGGDGSIIPLFRPFGMMHGYGLALKILLAARMRLRVDVIGAKV
jgi:hypothetical protein